MTAVVATPAHEMLPSEILHAEVEVAVIMCPRAKGFRLCGFRRDASMMYLGAIAAQFELSRKVVIHAMELADSVITEILPLCHLKALLCACLSVCAMLFDNEPPVGMDYVKVIGETQVDLHMFNRLQASLMRRCGWSVRSVAWTELSKLLSSHNMSSLHRMWISQYACQRLMRNGYCILTTHLLSSPWLIDMEFQVSPGASSFAKTMPKHDVYIQSTQSTEKT